MENSSRPQEWMNRFNNLVEFTLSGTHDPSKPILIDANDPNRYVSTSDAHRLISRLEGTFQEGSTVCLHLTNDVLYPVLVLAILHDGCTWTGTNPAYTSSEIENHIRVSKASYVVVAKEHKTKVLEAVKTIPFKVKVIEFVDLLDTIRGDTVPGHDEQQPEGKRVTVENGSQPFVNLLSCLKPHDYFHSGLKVISPSLEKVAVLMQTSGTTGLPKIASRSHRALIREASNIADDHAHKHYEVKRLVCTPMFHGFTFPEVVINALRQGVPTFIMKRFDETFASKIKAFHITETFAAPPMLQRLVNQPSCYNDLDSLQAIFHGGALLVRELHRSTQQMFTHHTRLVPVYGMTEGGWFATTKAPHVAPSGSVGQAVPGLEIKIDTSKQEYPDDQEKVGELLVRGPQLCTGYLDNVTATDALFENGWLRTGDLAYTKGGEIYIVGRSKELIKTNGWAVSPAELENALLDYPGVLDVGALSYGVGVDEHPAICVVRADDSVTEEGLKEHMKSRLASYKIARSKIHFVAEIPKNPAGKILRNILKSAIMDGQTSS